VQHKLNQKRADIVAKVPKYLAAIFSKETKLNYARRFNMAAGPLAKLPVSLSRGEDVFDQQ
jgi:hypothetical protein